MPCLICNDFKGWGELAERSDAPLEGSRHIQRDVSWGDVKSSALSCHYCRVLVEGCQGCFGQKGISEDSIMRCSLYFYYQAYIGEEADVDRFVRFDLTDKGSFIEFEFFATKGM